MKTVKPLRGKNQAFTLIEALMAAMLIGLAIAALASSSGAFTRYNAAGLDLSTAEFLIEEIRELMAPLPVSEDGTLGPEPGEVSVDMYDDVDDFHINSPFNPFNPPIDAFGVVMPEFAAFSQQIRVDKVNSADLTQTLDPTAVSDFYRVTVTITKGGQTITSSSWIRVNQ